MSRRNHCVLLALSFGLVRCAWAQATPDHSEVPGIGDLGLSDNQDSCVAISSGTIALSASLPVVLSAINVTKTIADGHTHVSGYYGIGNTFNGGLNTSHGFSGTDFSPQNGYFGPWSISGSNGGSVTSDSSHITISGNAGVGYSGAVKAINDAGFNGEADFTVAAAGLYKLSVTGSASGNGFADVSYFLKQTVDGQTTTILSDFSYFLESVGPVTMTLQPNTQYVLFASCYGSGDAGAPGGSGSVNAQIVAVPEPTAICCFLAAPLLMRRRRSSVR